MKTTKRLYPIVENISLNVISVASAKISRNQLTVRSVTYQRAPVDEVSSIVNINTV